MKTENSALPVKIKEVIDLCNIDDLSKVERIASNYAPLMIEVNDQIQLLKSLKKGVDGDDAKAKRISLDLGKISSRASSQKKSDKEVILIETRLIDKLFGVVEYSARLTQTEAKEIVNYAENIENERLEKLQSDRMGELEAYGVEFIPDNLSSMDDNVWTNYLSGNKLAYDQRKEAEKKAEAERIEREKIEKLNTDRKNALIPYFEFLSIAKQKITNFGELPAENFLSILNAAKSDKQKFDKEQIEIRKENERLKKEADLKEKKRLEDEKLLKAKAEKEKQEREAKEAKTKAENEAKLRIEREKREKIEAELKAKAEKEKQDAIAKEHLIQSELKKGDNAKIQDLKAGLIALKTKYSFKAKKNKIKLSNVCILIDKAVVFIDE